MTHEPTLPRHENFLCDVDTLLLDTHNPTTITPQSIAHLQAVHNASHPQQRKTKLTTRKAANQLKLI
jgi:hypothetical protein